MELFFILLFVCAVVTEAIVELLSKSSFFGFLRNFLGRGKGVLSRFFSDVIECPYCTSVWVSMFITSSIFILCPMSFIGNIYIDSFLFFIFCHRASNLVNSFCSSVSA